MENSLNLTPELLEQAAKSASAAALQTQAQENGITLTAEEAATYYAQLHPKTGALSDEELDNVSGGCEQASRNTCSCGGKGVIVHGKMKDYYKCSCGNTWEA